MIRLVYQWTVRLAICILAVHCVKALQIAPALVHRSLQIAWDARLVQSKVWSFKKNILAWQHTTSMSNGGHCPDLPVNGVLQLSTPLAVVRYKIARGPLKGGTGHPSLRGELQESNRVRDKVVSGAVPTWKRRNPAVAATNQNPESVTAWTRAGRGSGDVRRTGFGKSKASAEFHSSKISANQIRGELSAERSDEGSGLHIADRIDFRPQTDGHEHCPLPFGVLSPLLDSGLSWDQIQTAIFAEYGTTHSISALKRRLNDERNERVGVKRTGKTRRERSKERQRRYTDRDTVSVPIRPNELITVAALANMLGQDITDIVDYLVRREGYVATAGSILQAGLLTRVCTAFGAELEWVKGSEGGEGGGQSVDDHSGDPVVHHRPPIVAVMGHVDHGKTSLLDRLRNSSVAASEAGGITQSLSAFQVMRPPHAATFIDTPGHSAFAAMRRRGASVTDVVVLVVAADDGVMEQTKECISAARAANCPIVVAINKIDKDGISVDAVWASLADEGMLVEELGGDVQCALVSAKTGVGIEDLLDKIQLQAELLDFRADPKQELTGAVLEVRKDKKLGTVATILVRAGTLRVGDTLIAGQSWGKVRKLLSCTGTVLDHAGPSTPVQVIGLTGTPEAGAVVTVVADADLARAVTLARRDLEKEEQTDRSHAAIHKSATADIMSSSGQPHPIQGNRFSLVVKADTAGSLEALCSAITALPNNGRRAMDIIFRGLGDVSTSDVTMASTTSDACIVAYNVGCQQDAHKLCRSFGRTIISSPVIYNVLDSITDLQRTTGTGTDFDIIGRLCVKHVFPIGKGGKVAGCQLSDGSVKIKGKVRILRNDTIVHEGDVTSLKTGKHAVEMVTGKGVECGLTVEGFVDFLAGDVLEVVL